MYCRFCGTKIPDNVKFCPECGANLAPASAPSAAPEESAPAVPMAPENAAAPAMPHGTPDPAAAIGVIATPQRGMKWFKFIIYFQLWASLLSALIAAEKYFTGAYYEGYADWAYSFYCGLRELDICMGILYIALGVYAVFVQRSLAKLRAKGPVMYYSFCAASIALALLNVIAASLIVGYSLFSADIAAELAPSVILLFINIRYFNNRKHLFVNP